MEIIRPKDWLKWMWPMHSLTLLQETKKNIKTKTHSMVISFVWAYYLSLIYTLSTSSYYIIIRDGIFWYLLWLHHIARVWKRRIGSHVYGCIHRKTEIKQRTRKVQTRIICWCIYDSGAWWFFFSSIQLKTIRILRLVATKWSVVCAHSVRFSLLIFISCFRSFQNVKNEKKKNIL